MTSAPQRWLESHEDARPTRTGLTAITDEHGDVVAMRPGERLGEPRLLLSLPRGLAGKNRGVYQAVTARGATLDVAYQRAPAAEWTALAGARRDDLVAAALAGVVPALLLLFAQVVALWPLARFGARLLAPKAPEWRAAAQPVSPQETQDLQSMLFSETEARQATIARELHDGVGSSLAGLSLLLGNAQLFTREPEAVALLAKSQEQLAKTARQVRQISRGMMPAGQDGGALLPALQQFAADMSTTRGLVCTFDSRGNFQQLSAHVGGQLFRIAQEATANAIRHGGASRVRITLARAGERCRLTVQDNGRGCKTPSCNEPGPGVGLRSMAARAHAIGGTFALRATRGAGVRVRVQWIAPPVPAHSSASRSS